MNRAGHTTSGLAAGVAVVPCLNSDPTVLDVLFGGMLTAAAALLPDLDHPNATATNHFGPVTGFLSKMLRGLSATLYRFTKGPRDEPVTGTHRHITHTFLFAGLLGWGVTSGCHAAADHHPLAGVAAVLAVAAVLTSLATVYFGRWALIGPCGLIVTTFSTGQPIAEINVLAPHLGWYVAIGCAAHSVGDALTKDGSPLFYPAPIKGETFFEVRLPEPLRIRTGGPVENGLVVVFTALAIVLGVHALNPELLTHLVATAMA